MKCLFVYNPNSGRGKVVKKRDFIVDKLKTQYEAVDVIEANHPGHAKELAEYSCGKYDTLVVAGGDGTLNEVINGLAERENAPKIGYIPAGTTNDVAHSLKIPRGNIKKAIDVILKQKSFSHDIFKVNNKYGLYVCSTGLFCEASYSLSHQTKKNYGKIAYYIYGAARVFKAEPIYVKLKYDGKSLEGYYSLFLVANSRCVGGIKFNKHAELNDGYVDVFLVKSPKKRGLSLKSLFSVLGLFIFGFNKNRKQKMITYLKLKEFEVNISSKAKFTLDGEKALRGSFKFKAIEKGVEIFVP